jgi:tetratricopeptide (TPR) repeat protein
LKSAVVLSCLLATTPRTYAADSWIEVRSPHFTVVSNASEGTARNIAWQFEQFRSAIEKAFPWARVQLSRPVLVIAAKDENTMRALAPRYWERGNQIHPVSVFAPAADRYYITLRADVHAVETEGITPINPYQPAYWIYTTLSLESAFRHGLPLWIREGLSEVLSNTIVTPNELEFGRPMPALLTELQHGRFSLDQLISITSDSAVYTRETERARFTAQSWALMQYLLFGSSDREAQSARVDEIARLVLSGASSAQAIEKVFGSVKALEDAWSLYVGQGFFRYASVKVDTTVSAKSFQARSLGAAQSAAARAGFHAAMARPVEARAEIDQSRKLDARLAATYEVEGGLLEAEQKHEEAARAFAKAIELDSDNFYPYFRLAALTWKPGADTQTLQDLKKWLSRAVLLNNAFAPAFVNLSNVLLQLHQPADALVPARQAVALDPAETSYRLALAEALWNASQRDEAINEARTALANARTESERRDAQARLDSFAARGRIR